MYVCVGGRIVSLLPSSLSVYQFWIVCMDILMVIYLLGCRPLLLVLRKTLSYEIEEFFIIAAACYFGNWSVWFQGLPYAEARLD